MAIKKFNNPKKKTLYSLQTDVKTSIDFHIYTYPKRHINKYRRIYISPHNITPKQLKTPYMDFTDDLSLIDKDIEQFRSNKDEYWLDKLSRDNERMYVNAQVKDESYAVDHQTTNPVAYNPKYSNPNSNVNYGSHEERNLLQVTEPIKKLVGLENPERELKVVQKLVIDEAYNMSVGKGPVYTSSLARRPVNRGLKVMANAADNMASMGLIAPEGLSLPIVKGPVYNHTLQRHMDSGVGKSAFHLDRTPIQLEGHFPGKDKEEFFDENNAKEEHMFTMYDVSDDDFKN